MTEERGPFLTMAALCRDVIEDKQGNLSLIRIVSKITATGRGPEASEAMPPVRIPLFFVVTLKAGEAVGMHKLVVDLLAPAGGLTPIFEDEELELSKGTGSSGHNTIVRVSVAYGSEGVYWFRVFFDDVFVTQVPLEVRYQRANEADQMEHDREPR